MSFSSQRIGGDSMRVPSIATVGCLVLLVSCGSDSDTQSTQGVEDEPFRIAADEMGLTGEPRVTAERAYVAFKSNGFTGGGASCSQWLHGERVLHRGSRLSRVAAVSGHDTDRSSLTTTAAEPSSGRPGRPPTARSRR